MRKEIICTICPIGCNITVEGEGEDSESFRSHRRKMGDLIQTRGEQDGDKSHHAQDQDF